MLFFFIKEYQVINSCLESLQDSLKLQNLFEYKVDENANPLVKSLHSLLIKCIDFHYDITEEFCKKLSKKQRELGLPRMDFLDVGEEDGWRTTYNIMNVMVSNSELIESILPTLREEEMTEELPNNEELKVMRELVELMKPLSDAAELITKVKFTPISNIMPAIYSYLNFYLKNKNFESDQVDHVKTMMIEAFTLNFKFMLDSPDTDFYLTCTFLDPKYKSFSFLQQTALIDEYHGKVLSYLKANFDESENLNELETEFNSYKNLDVDLKTVFVSTFYQQNADKFPLLSSFAKKMLLIVANPIQARYFFSFEMSIAEECRQTEELMDTSVFLKENADLIDSEMKEFKLDDQNFDYEDDNEDEYDDDDEDDYSDDDYDDEDEYGLDDDVDEDVARLGHMLFARMMMGQFRADDDDDFDEDADEYDEDDDEDYEDDDHDGDDDEVEYRAICD
jgi:hypothetical protein